MTAPSSIDPTRFLHEQLGSASPDLLRSMLTRFPRAAWSLFVKDIRLSRAVCAGTRGSRRFRGACVKQIVAARTRRRTPSPTRSARPR